MGRECVFVIQKILTQNSTIDDIDDVLDSVH